MFCLCNLGEDANERGLMKVWKLPSTPTMPCSLAEVTGTIKENPYTLL